MNTVTESLTAESLPEEPSLTNLGTAKGCVFGGLGLGGRKSPAPPPEISSNPPTVDFGFQSADTNRNFSSGARRDSDCGKPRPDLLSPFATHRRARVMELGARKYGLRNWEKGMPLSVFLASAARHLNQFMLGETNEDHLAHCAFNLDAIMHGQEMIHRELWPLEYNDIPNYAPQPRTAGLSDLQQ